MLDIDVVDKIIINPPDYYIPAYRIGPFLTKNIALSKESNNFDKVDFFFKKKLKNLKYIYTETARSALNIALSELLLKKNDCVTIFTTSNNFYISSCVTKEIEKFSTWSRKIEENTKVILVNHEFGFPYQNLVNVKKYGFPIIEDCAHSFYSDNNESSVGKVGDFVIYSLPKYFPMQVGGVLASKNKYKPYESINTKTKDYIRSMLMPCVDGIEKIAKTRVINYNYLSEKFKEIGIKPFFKLGAGDVPGVFMFKLGKKVDKKYLKEWVWKHGIECSVFYGEDAFFIPTHQNLKNKDMDYFYEVVKYFHNVIIPSK